MKLDREIIVWLVSCLVAGCAAIIWLFSTFQPLADASEFKADVGHKLERMENKIDLLIQRSK